MFSIALELDRDRLLTVFPSPRVRHPDTPGALERLWGVGRNGRQRDADEEVGAKSQGLHVPLDGEGTVDGLKERQKASEFRGI